jgi:SAM-dependent methyltransferase
MSGYVDGHPFDRSGAAARSDLDTEAWRALFARMEQDQARFLARESEFRSPEYPWPRDPLHTWSRVWEYPYVFHHLEAFARGARGDRIPRALDLGSGVTFFPFAVASLGYDVVCADTDPVCATDLARAATVVEHAPGHVAFRLVDPRRVPLADAEADAVFCISVLEHIPDFVATVREIARVLRPGGLLVLTNDLDLRGDQQISVAGYQELLAELRRHFDFLHPEVTVHPADLLRSCEGRFAVRPPRGFGRLRFDLVQGVIKPLLGRAPRPLLEFDLAMTAFTMVRRSAP